MGNPAFTYQPNCGELEHKFSELLMKLLLELLNTTISNKYFVFNSFHRQFRPKASKIVINFASIDGPPSKPMWSIASP